MTTWKNIRNLIKDRNLKSDLWKADRKALLRIIKTAEKWGLEPGDFATASFPNMRVILPEARDAIRMCDKVRLADLFRWAGSLNTKELRAKMAHTEVEIVVFREIERDGKPTIELELTPDQFARLQSSIGPRFQFGPDK